MSAPLSVRPPVSIPTRTGRRPWSTQLLREWAAAKYPGVQLLEQVRLGPTSSSLIGVQVAPALEAMLRLNNWYADGLLVLPNEVLCVESKMTATPGAISQVKFYVREMMRTPSLQNLMQLQFVPVVLFAEDDEDVTRFARSEGCRVELFTPPWIADYLTQVQFRNRSTPAPQGNGEPS